MTTADPQSPAALPAQEAADWIARFRQTHRRAPRILHLGNVAGNAYQNAKLLNAAGADCDVLSADYYHVMGSPEWEDADFTGKLGSLHYPAWHKADLHGFVRPRWYAAAPRRMAIAYLLARRRGDAAAAGRLWKQMGRIYRYFCFREHSVFRRGLLALEGVAFRLLARLRGEGGRAQGASAAPPCPHPAVRRAMADAKALFPGRPIALDAHWNSDYMPEAAALYAPLFAEYDIVQAYATDGIWCYLAGISHYVCFEHGTIRDICAAEDDTTHLMLLAYAASRGFMVTNTDCLGSARYLREASGTPYVLGLHGLPVEDIAQKLHRLPPARGAEARFGVPAHIPLFFSPSRHTYLPEQGIFLKGDEQVVAAAARLAETGRDFRLVLTDWGDGSERIRALVAACPALTQKVIWTPPLGKEAFARSFLQVNAVLDQFYLPVFGAIAFETMAAGHALLLSKRIPEAWLQDFFGSMPPYAGCDGEDDLFAAMLAVAENPAAAAQTAAQAKEWVLRAHSNRRIVEKNCELYSLGGLPLCEDGTRPARAD